MHTVIVAARASMHMHVKLALVVVRRGHLSQIAHHHALVRQKLHLGPLGRGNGVLLGLCLMQGLATCVLLSLFVLDGLFAFIKVAAHIVAAESVREDNRDFHTGFGSLLKNTAANTTALWLDWYCSEPTTRLNTIVVHTVDTIAVLLMVGLLWLPLTRSVRIMLLQGRLIVLTATAFVIWVGAAPHR